MIEKIKHLGVILTIGILFTIFIFAITNSIYPKPSLNHFCNKSAKIEQPVDPEKCGKIMPQALDCRGPIEYIYDKDGCPVEARCNPCFEAFESALEKYFLILFITASISGVAAVLFGLFYKKKDKFWALIKNGFLLGGLICLFAGTIVYYQKMGRFLKPLVILIELIIVILVTYKIIKKKK